MGSSPLTRGARVVSDCCYRRAGLIPAHAGSTEVFVHQLHAVWGSSPLTRGACLCACLNSVDKRLIPAHAGSTSVVTPALISARAHPRSRGEHPKPRAVIGTPWGSSPLTRGAHDPVHARAQGRGLIPAHAGSTLGFLSVSTFARAHPRSRGEHALGNPLHPFGVGSSPLTRGARGGVGGVFAVAGLIPAHAGSTYRSYSLSLVRRAHPRSRGEHAPVREALEIPEGSSPLTRGAQGRVGSLAQARRLIPAHAGSTQSEKHL